MSLNFLLDTTLKASSWAIYNGYYGVSNLIYGKQKDPMMEKMDIIETKLNELTTKIPAQENDIRFYWITKDKYPNKSWVIISESCLIKFTKSKSDALKTIADYLDTDPEKKFTLIQVGSENNQYYL